MNSRNSVFSANPSQLFAIEVDRHFAIEVCDE
jgi:hypothetical protein